MSIRLGDRNSKLKPICLDMPSPGMQRLFRQMGRKKSLIDSTVQKAIQQCVVEHEEHNRAIRSCGHPLHPDLPPDTSCRHLDSCLALGTVRSVRESEVDFVHHFLIIIKLN